MAEVTTIKEVAVSVGHRQLRAMATRAAFIQVRRNISQADSRTLRYCGSNFMKAYVMTTGAVFGLLTLAHIWRVIAEEPHLATEPWYVLITVASAALCLWALRLLWRSPRS